MAVAATAKPAYRVYGAGRLLIYICGLDGTGELFFKQIPRLSAAYRVVTFHQRDSSVVTYEELADDVAAIIQDMGEQSATLVAESFGGAVAFTVALRYPAMVERLIIVNSFARYRRRLRIKLAAWLSAILPFVWVQPVRVIASTLGLFIDGVGQETRRKFFAIARSIKRAGYIRRLRLIEQVNLEPHLAEIDAPTLLIATDKDLLVPSIREAERMAARLPNAMVKIIRGAGHACLLGDRVCLADEIEEWEAKVSSNRRLATRNDPSARFGTAS